MKMKINQKLQTVICVVLCVSIITVTSGCSAFRPRTETINISSNPEGADVTVNGATYRTPAQASVRRDGSIAIQCYKKGYVPYNRTIDTHLNTTGILDIVGTCIFIIPCIGLFTPGAYSLDETNVNVSLYKE